MTTYEVSILVDFRRIQEYRVREALLSCQPLRISNLIGVGCYHPLASRVERCRYRHHFYSRLALVSCSSSRPASDGRN